MRRAWGCSILNLVRILFLTSRMPYPPVGGDRFRVFHFIHSLAQAMHEVHLLTFDGAARNASVPPPLGTLLASHRTVALPATISALRAFAALPGTRPLQVAYYESRRMRTALGEALDRVKPDLVYTHLFRMAPYSLQLMAERRETRRPTWILDLTDVISSEIGRSLPFRRGPDRWLYEVEGNRIARYEERIAGRFDRCWVISEAESRTLASMAPGARIEVVRNGLNGNAPPASNGVNAPASSREPATLLFFGYLKIAHNRDAARHLARDIFPIVRTSVPDALLEIAGKDSDLLGSSVRGEGIRARGYVPHPEETFARATVFVAPLRFAAGVQNKVLQALDAGLPVVTTPVVREGLAPLPPDLLRVGETPEEIAGEVVKLIRDPTLARDLGARGRQWVRSRFRWEDAVRAFEAAQASPGVK